MNIVLACGKNAQCARPYLGSLVRMACLVIVVSLMAWGTPISGQESAVGRDANGSVAKSAVVEPAMVDSQEPLEEGQGEAAVESTVPEPSKVDLLRNRLACFAFFGGLLLVFLALLFGYLRLDHATRGFHSGRLQMTALVLCAIVLVVGYLIWTHLLFK